MIKFKFKQINQDQPYRDCPPALGADGIMGDTARAGSNADDIVHPGRPQTLSPAHSSTQAPPSDTG
jgi:hypothetical protein